MEKTINGLLASYEKGHINRRQLVGGLIMMAAGSNASAAGTQAKAVSVNHIAITVGDVKKSSKFYQASSACRSASKTKNRLRSASAIAVSSFVAAKTPAPLRIS